MNPTAYCIRILKFWPSILNKYRTLSDIPTAGSLFGWALLNLEIEMGQRAEEDHFALFMKGAFVKRINSEIKCKVCKRKKGFLALGNTH